jgi:SAM-dependent methyltransferase
MRIKNNFKKWNKTNSYKNKYPPSYPNEMMIKNILSKDCSFFFENFNNLKKLEILEIGCMGGNNLRFFLENNCKTYGVEVNKTLVNLCINNLDRLGYKINKNNIQIGNNLLIPFRKKFDLILSINTLHYNNGNDVLKSIKNFKNYLKPGGIAIIETIGPKHIFFRNSKKIKKLEYLLNLKKDFRHKSIFGFFDGKEHFKKILNKFFNKIEIKERTEDFGKLKLQFLQAVCKIN